MLVAFASWDWERFVQERQRHRGRDTLPKEKARWHPACPHVQEPEHTIGTSLGTMLLVFQMGQVT